MQLILRQLHPKLLKIILQYMRSHTKADKAYHWLDLVTSLAHSQLMYMLHINLHSNCCTKNDIPEYIELLPETVYHICDIFYSLWSFDMMWPALRLYHRCTQRDFDKDNEWVHGHKVASFSECWMITVPTVRSYPIGSTICMYHDSHDWGVSLSRRTHVMQSDSLSVWLPCPLSVYGFASCKFWNSV